MKQQTTAVIESVLVDGESLPLARQALIELELSAIDTGGGFHDPILDFVYELKVADEQLLRPAKEQRLRLIVQDPSDAGHALTISYRDELKRLGEHHWQGMGRLSGDQSGREVVTFVMQCVRSGA